jgi:hypothetical protein
MKKEQFFKQYGNQLIQVNTDSAETGDYHLYAPEESDRALKYQQHGYLIASVFEQENGEDLIVLDNDTSTGFHKIGYLVLTQNKDE